ncbi:MAG TPA: hypothetical protein VEN29_16030 [Casimicrobiaceae bacterium]|nr:hypothetical protein [Casimicrobiaceae bacterium]
MIERRSFRLGEKRSTWWLGIPLLCASCLHAQPVIHNDENLDSHRTEAWAMNYIGASTFMTSFGETPALAPWKWGIALDANYIPKLTDEQQRVGLHGIKHEDLNRSPVFGRLRILLGLPGDFVAGLGYTPPLSIAGTQPLDLFAFSIGRRLFEKDELTLSMQVFGQHGRARGDVTCPTRIAGNPDREQNPFGCDAPSNDHIYLNYYGLEAVAAWKRESWHAYVSGGFARTEFSVQVDALTFGERDRSLLIAQGALPFGTAGVSVDLDKHWKLGFEVMYVPLYVQRQPNQPSENDSLTSPRVQLLYRFD